MSKNDFLLRSNTQAALDDLRMVQASTDEEWQAVREFRQKYFFDKVPIADPYTWTFNHADYVHFVLYKDDKLIGYADIQLWPEQRAALRIIVLHEPYRNSGIGGAFLKMCEHWLQEKKLKTLHIQSTPEAYRFYCKHDYVEMPFNDPEGHESHPRDIEMGKVL